MDGELFNIHSVFWIRIRGIYITFPPPWGWEKNEKPSLRGKMKKEKKEKKGKKGKRGKRKKNV